MKNQLDWRDVLENPKNPNAPAPIGPHILQTYQDKAFLIEAISVYAAAGLRRNEGIMLVLTKDHQNLVLQRLEQGACNPQEAIHQKKLIFLDADELLSKFMKNGKPDSVIFKQTLNALLDPMQRQFSGIRIYGEMVNVLWHQGNRQAGIQLEALWNELAHHYEFILFCAYAINPLDKEVYEGSLQEVCAHHSHFIPIDDYEALEKSVDRASDQVMGQSLSNMVRILTPLDAPPTAHMPEAQAALFWLAEHMPGTAQKVLAKLQSNAA